jgi:hypothetical protein
MDLFNIHSKFGFIINICMRVLVRKKKNYYNKYSAFYLAELRNARSLLYIKEMNLTPIDVLHRSGVTILICLLT